MRRALHVPAVRKNLSIDLLQKDSTSRGHPAFAGRELREGLAHDIQSQRFTREVRVRTEVIREVMFDMRQLPIDGDEGVDKLSRSQVMPGRAYRSLIVSRVIT